MQTALLAQTIAPLEQKNKLHNMNKKYILPLIILLSSMGYAQQPIAVETWQTHFNYSDGKDVELIDHTLFYITENTILKLDLTENALLHLDKTNGLSDVGINCTTADTANAALIIAYNNTNIDIYQKGRIYNIPDIFNKQISGEKTINSILCHNNIVYLACGFGIVCIDIKQKNIKDTWFFQAEDRQYPVIDICISGDSIYALTENTLYFNILNNSQINNFLSWQADTTLENTGVLQHITRYGNYLLCAKQDITGDALKPLKNNIYYREDNTWKIHPALSQSEYTNMECKHNKLILTNDTCAEAWTLQADGTLNKYSSTYCSAAVGAVCTREGYIYAASADDGLIRGRWEEYFPYRISSPCSDEGWKMDWKKGKLTMVHGGHANWTPRWIPARTSILTDRHWRNIAYDFNYKYYYSLIDIKIAPYDTSVIYAASLVQGLIKIKDNAICQVYNQNNSSLHALEIDTGTTRVLALDFDAKNNLWMTNFSSTTQLSVLTRDGQWHAYNIPYSGEYITGNIFCDSRGLIWLTNDRNRNLILFNPNKTPLNPADDEWIKLNTALTEENGPFEYIYAIAEDKDGKIWLGTNAGLKVYHSPSRLTGNSAILPSPIAVQTISGTDTLVELVLKSEIVRDICIDGGNRKWVATDNAGVFLLSADAKTEILHFTKENSPLLSNTVMDICIDGYSGEVYFATDKGLISYRYTATDGNETQDSLKIFPNPVRGNFEGYITISGLVDDSEVKITDAAGRLVYRTTSNGGTAVWDGRRFDGSKVATGVYYVFASGGNKMKLKKTGKILFIK